MKPLPEDEGTDLPVECTPTKIKITKAARRRIEELLLNHITRTMGHYCDQVGIKYQNYWGVLAGKRLCTLEFLNKLLSGIGYRVTAETRLVVHRIDAGQPAHNADYTEPET